MKIVGIILLLSKIMLPVIGENKDIASMWLAVRSFISRLQVFKDDITDGSMDHFPTLKQYIEKLDNPDSTDISKAELFIVDVLAEFQRRFRACRQIEGVIDLVLAPHSGSTTWIDQLPRFSDISVAALQLNICDFSSDPAAKQQLSELGLPY